MVDFSNTILLRGADVCCSENYVLIIDGQKIFSELQSDFLGGLSRSSCKPQQCSTGTSVLISFHCIHLHPLKTSTQVQYFITSQSDVQVHDGFASAPNCRVHVRRPAPLHEGCFSCIGVRHLHTRLEVVHATSTRLFEQAVYSAVSSRKL